MAVLDGAFSWVPNPFSHALGGAKGIFGGLKEGIIGPIRDVYYDTRQVFTGPPETRTTSLLHLGADMVRLTPVIWPLEILFTTAYGAFNGFFHPENAFNPLNPISKWLHKDIQGHPSLKQAESKPNFEAREPVHVANPIQHEAPGTDRPQPAQAEPAVKPDMAEVGEHLAQARDELYDQRDVAADKRQHEIEQWLKENNANYLNLTTAERERCLQEAVSAGITLTQLQAMDPEVQTAAFNTVNDLINQGFPNDQQRMSLLDEAFSSIANGTDPGQVWDSWKGLSEQHPEVGDILQRAIAEQPSVAGFFEPILSQPADGKGQGFWDQTITIPPEALQEAADHVAAGRGMEAAETLLEQAEPVPGHDNDQGGYQPPGGGDRWTDAPVRPEDMDDVARGIGDIADGRPEEGMDRIIEAGRESANEQQNGGGSSYSPAHDEPISSADARDLTQGLETIRDNSGEFRDNLQELVSTVGNETARDDGGMTPD